MNGEVVIRKEDFLGLDYNRERSRFRVWAPGQKQIFLNLYSSAESMMPRSFAMTREGDFFQFSLEGDWAGSFYTYQLGNKELTDPYSIASSINSRRSAILDLAQTDPEGFRQSGYVETPPNQAIIYELHVGDFTMDATSGLYFRGRYLGLVEEGGRFEDLSTGLDHLKDLGITHVHLMPVYDFFTVDERPSRFRKDDNYNWGYDPELYNVPEGSYATRPEEPGNRIHELKILVQALHEAHIGVVMDVVYNHSYKTADSNLNILAPGAYYRSKGSVLTNGSGVGNELATERAMVRHFIIHSLLYWQREYKIDGFRFDLMALIDRETVRQAVHQLRQVNPNVLIYGEPWAGGVTALPQSQQTLWTRQCQDDFALFNEEFRKGIKGDNDGAEKGFIQGNWQKRASIEKGLAGSISFQIQDKKLEREQIERGKDQLPLRHLSEEEKQALRQGYVLDPVHSINYFDAHDNLILEDKLAITAGDEKRMEEMTRLAFALLLTAQGIPFFHAGSEFRRSKKGEANSYRSPWSVNAVDWSLKAKNRDLFRYVQELIAFRKSLPCLQLARGWEVRKWMKILKFSNDNIVASLIQKEEEDPDHFLLILYSDAWLPVSVDLEKVFQSLDVYRIQMQKIFDKRGRALMNRVEINRSERIRLSVDPISMTVYEICRCWEG